MSIGGRSRSRSRNQGNSQALLLVVAVGIGLIVSGFVVAPSVAFTTGSVDRGTAVQVVDDTDGFLGIDVADSMQAGTEGRLVTVTNQLNQTLTVDVSSSATLSNNQATLAPGDSLTTAATVSCESPPSEVGLTISASAGGQFSGLATRSASVDTTDCADSTLAFGSIEIIDQTTSGTGNKVEYAVTYSVEGNSTAFDRVSVDFKNLDRGDKVRTRESTVQRDTISFKKGGNRDEQRYEITVRLFDSAGEIESERIVLTDTADGSGTVYQAS